MARTPVQSEQAFRDKRFRNTFLIFAEGGGAHAGHAAFPAAPSK
jgi:hypothetical protein